MSPPPKAPIAFTPSALRRAGLAPAPLWRRALLVAVGPLLVTGVVAGARATGVLEGVELKTYDLRFRVRNALRGPPPAPPESLIVKVDDDLFDKLEIRESLELRKYFSMLLQMLFTEEGPRARVAVFDYWLAQVITPNAESDEVSARVRPYLDLDRSQEETNPLASGADLFVALGCLDAETLGALRASENPKERRLLEAIEERGKRVAERMAERDPVFAPHGISNAKRRLLYVKAVKDIEQDLALALLILDRPVVVARFVDPDGGWREPDPLFATAATAIGTIQALKDRDGVLRRVPPIAVMNVRTGEWTLPLGLTAGVVYEGIPPDQVAPLRIGRHVLPNQEYHRPNFLGPPQTVKTESLLRALRAFPGAPEELMSKLKDEKIPPLLPEEYQDRAVFVGDLSLTGQDFVIAPFARYGTARGAGGGAEEASLGEMPGVEVHATALDSLLRDRFLEVSSGGAVVLTLVVAALAGAIFYLPRLGFFWPTLLLLLFIGVLLVASYGLFLRGYSLDVWPAMSSLGLNFAFGMTVLGFLESRKRAEVTQVFGQYLAPEVVKRIVAGELSVDLGGHTKDLTVLFSDIRGFTKLAESLPASEVSDLLQTYFSEMTKVIQERRGTLDKFIGDAIMAFWGDPEEQPDHAVRAAETVLDMVVALEKLQDRDPRSAMKMLRTGFGLNTGEVIVGNLGSPDRKSYTVIGDVVNIASRLEGMNKEYGTRIIAGEATAAKLGPQFVLRELDWLRAVGKTKPTTVYEVLGRPGQVPEKRLAAAAAYAKGLAAWRKGDFAEADKQFVSALGADPTDGPSATFRARCADYLIHAPEGAWDGVFVPTHK
ncbi:MAG: CHASE2 domain-containing protein [Planctomycetales bacterium]|nr:CHASE2 domain-containing protein [Planctomycetales bacterium]